MRVAIIGAGPSGLTAAKEALECGLEPTVFEKSHLIGGLWKPEGGSAWDTMRTNISHKSCMFSDFPWKNPSGDFPNQSEVYNYLNEYADHFNLHPYIQLESEVSAVRQEYDKWKVEWLTHSNDRQSEEFDCILICTGIFTKAHIPEISGMETFPGRILHSQDFKSASSFKDKHVAVIGSSFSGTEIAAVLADVASKVTHVASKAMWIIPRYLPSGDGNKTVDSVFFTRRGAASSTNLSPQEYYERQNKWFRNILKQEETDHRLRVEGPDTQPPFVAFSDSYTDKVRKNAIEVRRAKLLEIEGQNLILSDGTTATADAVIVATGYRADLPFLEESVKQKIEFDPNDQFQPALLYKCMLHPDLKNLAFVGYYRGPFFAAIELQARWAIGIFTSAIAQPSEEEQRKGIDEERVIRQLHPRPQFPHSTYVAMCEDLAKDAGCLPDLEKIKDKDPDLHKMLWEGPFSAASYRLTGPNSNPELALSIIRNLNTPNNNI